MFYYRCLSILRRKEYKDLPYYLFEFNFHFFLMFIPINFMNTKNLNNDEKEQFDIYHKKRITNLLLFFFSFIIFILIIIILDYFGIKFY